MASPTSSHPYRFDSRWGKPRERELANQQTKQIWGSANDHSTGFVKWRPSQRWAHPIFPPHQLTDFFEFSKLGSHKDPIFLHQKYVKDGLSIAQIGAQTFSSQRTILKALARANIPLRPEDRPATSQLLFGKKRVGGKVVNNPSEQKVLAKMQSLRSAGYSYPEIVRILNDLGYPAKRGGKWRLKVAYEVLQRNQ